MSRFAQAIRPFVHAELEASAEAERRGDHRLAFHHLERAHVLSQEATLEHVRVHSQMLLYALRRRDAREAFGQFLRMTLAAPLALVGIVPIGNTGGSNVNGFRPMAVPADLQEIIDAARRRAP